MLQPPKGVPALGKEIANALKLNLSNQIHLQAASPEAARWVADLVGKREIRDVNTSSGPHGITRRRRRLDAGTLLDHPGKAAPNETFPGP